MTFDVLVPTDRRLAASERALASAAEVVGTAIRGCQRLGRDGASIDCLKVMQHEILALSPTEPKETDITVSCRCSWVGKQSDLKGFGGARCCPRCSAPFESFPPALSTVAGEEHAGPN